ncbi:efflux RND transporter periplasmic adaptor subunit [Patescibacteria group bacterium]|nr:efflux RND transporter periplasmic adaptor subunit [Patescibacteria group bacterium]
MIKKRIAKFKKLSKIKKIILFLILIALSFFVYKTFFKKTDEIIYKTEKVRKGTIISLVSDTGEILTSGKVDIPSTITGITENVYVKNGDLVKSGQKLFSVKSTASQADKTAAYATYLKAKSSLASAQNSLLSLESSMWSAHEKYRDNGWGRTVDDPIYIQTNRDFLAAEANYKNQQQVITQSKISLNNAWLEYQKVAGGDVTAPIAGTIANLSVSHGQQVTTGDISLMIKNETDSWAKLSVSEGDVGKITVGQTATVYVDALSGTQITGTVDRFDDIGTDTSGIITYNVYINLGRVEETVKAGMTVQIDIETAKAEDVLLVSNTAIKTYQGVKTVQILDKDSGEPLYLPVEIGIVGDTQTEIEKGLTEGQEIIVSQSSDSASGSTSSTSRFPAGGMIMH